MKKILILLAACLVGLVACSHGNGNSAGGGSGNGNGNGGDAVTYIGTKDPTEAKEVGDIVFNDGSATPYTASLRLTTEQKKAAIAIIFYKGTDLNNGEDTTIVRTLGVGLKQDIMQLVWCTSSAQAYDRIITTIVSAPSSKDAFPTFTGDINGSDNLEQIEDFEGVDDTTGAGAEERYPAFYFAKNYVNQKIGNETKSRIISGSEYATGWFLPTIAELSQINACINDSENGVDLNEASELCDGNRFETQCYYWSSNQWVSDQSTDKHCAYGFVFGTSSIFVPDHKSADDNSGLKGITCAIREF